MDIDSLIDFLLWCAIIDGALLAVWTLACLIMPELVYRTQSRWFPMSRETFTVVMYCFIGVFKIFFIVFNLVPLVALLLIK
jgi:hypothetical protein